MNNTPFKIKDKTLHFSDINLKEVTDRFGTPTYVFSKKIIQNNISHLKKTFQKHYPKTEIVYSTKNNLNYDIVSLIADEVDCIETTSQLELLLVQKLAKEKNKPLNLISTNLYKPDGLIQQIIEHKNLSSIIGKPMEGLIAIDSYQDMRNIERNAKKMNQKVKVLVRVNPGILMSREENIFASAYPDAKCSVIIQNIQPLIEMSKEPNIKEWLLERKIQPKFDYAERLIEEVEKSSHLELVGLHGHIGSQITNMDYFTHFFEIITLFFKITEEKLGRKLEYLDLGGGYPVQYYPEEVMPSINEIALKLSQKIKNAKISPTLIIESGRYITASAGILLTEVTVTKENPSGGKIAVLDLSVYSDLLDVIAANWYYQSELVNDMPDAINEKLDAWELVGATNDTLDQLNPINIDVPARTFPRDLKTRDIIAIINAGAYTLPFNNNYCGKPKPMIVLIDDDVPEKIRLLKRDY